ncbi:ComEC/Rec2 family competence protein [Corynebacterium pacaense]|uniref:ComEC/Rec2 family competence protein n=1 Tax=Corynebacterium pacaense TaxID=1816684 RepID=UPI0009BA569D|nr:ComEC/Rec2 family competence protein [Corynebacterium pacaense]
MRELRLVPTALLTWAVVLSVVLSRSWMIATLVILGAVLVCALLGQWGQALVATSIPLCAGAIAYARVRMAATTLEGELVGSVGSVRRLDGGLSILQLELPGYPVPVPLMLRGGHEVAPGSVIAVAGRISPSERPGVGEWILNASSVEHLQDPSGAAAWSNHVRDSFLTTVRQHVGESSQGLVPGMVLGDTRLQSTADAQMYVDTGLSHLSAVSGANVAIVTASVMVVLSLLTLGPRVQIGGACLALVVFVALVGTEPSVLRASVTGMVGLLAVLNSTRMEPIHGLGLAVIALLFWDTDLAVHYGFALSVAATAGIVALHPLLYRALARTGLPDILVRALAVAVAADVVTLPLVAMMAGRIPLVSVLANVLAAPAVPPVTLLGLFAALLTLLPGSLEVVPLSILEPFTWWIHQVASRCSTLPGASLEIPSGWTGPVWVVVGCAWLVLAIHYGHARWVVAVALMGAVVSWNQTRLPPVVDPSELNHVVVDTVEEAVDVGTGVELIVVREGGTAADRPTVTRAGIPVLFPNRDGPVTLHTDGTQHAADRRF